MNAQERYHKTAEILKKFKNGEKRYHESAVFNQVVQMLVREADVYEIIDGLIYVAEDCQNALAEQILRGAPTRYIKIESSFQELIYKYEKENENILNRRPDLTLQGDFTPDGIKIFCNVGFIEELKKLKT